MAWAETRVGELRKRDAQEWNGSFASGARQDDAKRIAFLEQHGFRYSAKFAEVNMLRALTEPIPDSVLPIGCQVRAVAEADEIPNRAAAQREVWLPWTVGNVSDDDYARLMRLPGYNRDLDVVAVTSDGVIAATVNGWIDPVNRIGDFGEVGALPAYRRQGLARAALLGWDSAADSGIFLRPDRILLSSRVCARPAYRHHCLFSPHVTPSVRWA